MITETAWTDHGQILTETAGAVKFGVILGLILGSFWGQFWGHFRVHSGVHFGVILGSILGSKFGHFEGPKNEGPPLRNHYFWEPVLASEREARSSGHSYHKRLQAFELGRTNCH